MSRHLQAFACSPTLTYYNTPAPGSLLLGLSALAYRTSLAPLGRLLQSHEQRILDIVTQEVE